MNPAPGLKRFLEIFNSNASGVLSTITNQNIELTDSFYDAFKFEAISNSVELPCVLLSLSFTGEQSFNTQLILDKKTVSTLSDLMMLGDGDMDYNPEEHNDAIKEMLNQVLGSMTSELASEGINLSGTVSDVEFSDLEIQKDFMIDNAIVSIDYQILNKNNTSFLAFDPQAQSSIENVFNKMDQSSHSTMGNAGRASQPMREEPVKVSRAQFSEFEEIRPSTGKNVNINLLMDIVLPVTVELGRKNMKIREILEIGQGSVVELEKQAGDMVELLINGKKFAVGEVMVADDNYAVRIVNLVSREDRIKTLGQE